MKLALEILIASAINCAVLAGAAFAMNNMALETVWSILK